MIGGHRREFIERACHCHGRIIHQHNVNHITGIGQEVELRLTPLIHLCCTARADCAACLRHRCDRKGGDSARPNLKRLIIGDNRREGIGLNSPNADAIHKHIVHHITDLCGEIEAGRCVIPHTRNPAAVNRAARPDDGRARASDGLNLVDERIDVQRHCYD